jgi:hypothetical protein
MKDLIGQRFGKWTVVRQDGRKSGQIGWFCKCDCGSTKTVAGAVLRKGKSRSCGCYRKSVKTTHGMYQTPIHRVWSNMIQRCHNPKDTAYHNYGARGIAVCDRWRGAFEAFYTDVGDIPFVGAELDRVNNDLGYNLDNVRWVTCSENQLNTRRTVKLTLNGKTQAIMQWSRELGIPHSTIRARLKAGKSAEEALKNKLTEG